MKRSQIRWILLGVITTAGIFSLSVYAMSLHRQLEEVRTELKQEAERSRTLESSLEDSQDTISEKDEELRVKEASLSEKEKQLNNKIEELNASKTELDRQKLQAQELIAVADELRADMRTVTECFGGITLAFVSDSQAEVIRYLGSVQRQCEEAAEIVEDL
jgi:septal ring factor EnvC (AmiA/AmiB activator)